MKKLLFILILFTLPLSASASFDRNLKYGSKGTDVAELQEFLLDQGVYSGPVTGNYYALTTKGVKAFQSREKLAVTGTVNPATRNRLNQLLAESLADEEKETVADQLSNPELARTDELPKNTPAPLDFSNPWTSPSTLQPNKPVTDWCSNILGDQGFVPLGYTWQSSNFCEINNTPAVETTNPIIKNENALVRLQARLSKPDGRRGFIQFDYQSTAGPVIFSVSQNLETKISILANFGNPRNAQCSVSSERLPSGEILWGGSIEPKTVWIEDVLGTNLKKLREQIYYRQSVGVTTPMLYNYKVSCNNSDGTTSSDEIIFSFVY